MKCVEKEKAINLRKSGLSTIKIAKELGIAKSTAFLWTKNVELTTEQKDKLFKGKTLNWKVNFINNVKKWKDKRLNYQLVGETEINRNDWEHAAGCMLFWGEGCKDKNVVSITNCDPYMLKFFVGFLKKFYRVTNDTISLSFQYHEGNGTKEDIFSYWINLLDLSGCKTTKPYLKQKKPGVMTKHKYGICRLTVCSTEIVNRLWGSVQKYIGFSAPEILK